MNLIKKFSFSVLFLLSQHFLLAQSTARSVYNLYGLGTLEQQGLCQFESMGYSSIASRSTQNVNLENPAGLNAVKQANQIMDVGLYRTSTFQRAEGESFNSTSGNIGSLNFWFSGGPKTAFAFGASKFSDASYNITNFNNRNTSLGNYSSIFVGEGGVSQMYLAFGQRVVKNLNVGAKVNFLFGSLEKTEQVFLNDFNTTLNIEDTRSFVSSVLDLGIQYTVPLGESSQLTIGSTYRTGSNISIDETSYILSAARTDSISSEDESSLYLPQHVGVGLSYQSKKWQLNMDYQVERWGSNDDDNDYSYNDRHIISAGGEFIKDRFSSNYFDRIAFRAGFGAQSNYVTVRNTDYISYIVSAGAGLPLNRGSMLSIGYQYFQNGTTNSGLVKEISHKLSLNISIKDLWFIKRVYD